MSIAPSWIAGKRASLTRGGLKIKLVRFNNCIIASDERHVNEKRRDELENKKAPRRAKRGL